MLLALISVFYAIYHGPEGLKRIAERTHLLAKMLAAGLNQAGFTLRHSQFFDTLVVETGANTQAIVRKAQAEGINLRPFVDAVGISLNETTQANDLAQLLQLFGAPVDLPQLEQQAVSDNRLGHSGAHQPVFNPPGLQPLPQRNRDAALPKAPGIKKT